MSESQEDDSKDNGKWHIVEFTDSNTVDAVPDFWLRKNGAEVVYPPWTNLSRVMRAITKRAQPQPDWKSFSLSKVFWGAGAYILYL